MPQKLGADGKYRPAPHAAAGRTEKEEWKDDLDEEQDLDKTDEGDASAVDPFAAGARGAGAKGGGFNPFGAVGGTDKADEDDDGLWDSDPIAAAARADGKAAGAGELPF